MAKKILLVDDDAGILDSVSMLLHEYGYDVNTCIDGDVAEYLAEDKPDVILLDVWISGWNGKEVCKQLKASEKTRDIPVLLMSAHKDIEQAADDSGADGFIAKPFDIDVLLQKVDSVIKT